MQLSSDLLTFGAKKIGSSDTMLTFGEDFSSGFLCGTEDKRLSSNQSMFQTLLKE